MALEFFTPDNLSAELKQEVVSFLDSQSTSHPYQFLQWADSSSRLAILREAGRICWFAHWGAQYPLGRRVGMFRAAAINRGPVCDDRALWGAGFGELLQHMRREGLIYLDAAPDWPGAASDVPPQKASPMPLEVRRFSLRLDLAQTPEEILTQFRKNTRYEVRRAERAGIEVRPATTANEVEEFLALYERLAERKGFAADSPQHLRDIIGWLLAEPSRGALLVARDQTSMAGGAVIVRAGRRCWYVWGASDKRPDFSAGHVVQWQAILWAKSQGCTEYDFGGYTPGATSGPAWFKEGFGGQAVELTPAQRYVFRPWLYRFVDSIVKMRSAGER